MVDEMESLHKIEAWDLVEFVGWKEAISSKWVFKKNTNAEGKVEKYKAQLVAKVYSHVPRIDFDDIFSLVAKVASITLLLSVVATFDFEVEPMEVKTTFLHGDLEEEIYMKQHEGFVVKGNKEMVTSSNPKSTQGTFRRAGRALLEVIEVANETRPCVTRCPKTQEEEEAMSRVPYASAVSSLMYAMVCTRPDISHVVGVLSRFMSKPGKEHWTTVKQIFRYLHDTSDYGLCYQGRPGLDNVLDIRGFVDED
eukprot:PITA_09231